MKQILQLTVAFVLLLSASAGSRLFAQQHPSREPIKVYLFVNPYMMPNIPPGGMGLYDGRIDAAVNGGTIPYQYSSDNDACSISPAFTDLAAGTFHVAVLKSDRS